MQAFNAALTGHILLAWAMGLNAYLFLARGNGVGLIGLLLGAVALVCAHIGSTLDATEQTGVREAYIATAVWTALAWIFFILAASI